MKDTFARALLACTALSCVGFAAPALAQSTPQASGPTDLQEVVVTARRINERLQDVPISITVFNQEKLTNANVVNSQDLARVTPSLSVNSNFGSDNSSFAIRGFIQENGTAPAVGVYFADVVAPRGASNGVPAGDGAGAGSFFDLENVQVLKGPQGTLFGRNTTGGAVLLVPVKPSREFEGYVEGSYGNYDMRRLQAVVNIPLDDQVRLRVGVDRQMRDGYLHNTSGVGPTRLSNVNYTAVRASLVMDITPDVENYTIASLSHSANYGDVQKLIAGPGGAFSPMTLAQAAAQGSGYYDVRQLQAHPESRLDTWQVINTTTWHATDNLVVKNIASYAELKDDAATSLFGVDLQLGPFNLPFTESHHIPGGHTAHESTYTDELQFQGDALDNRLNWQTGAYFETARPLGGDVGAQSGFLASCIDSQTFQCTDVLGAGATGQALAAGAPPGTVIHVGTINYTAGQTTFRDLGLYGQATYKLTDQFKLTAGYRYTWDREKVISTQKIYFLAFPPSFGLFPGPGNPVCTQPATTPNGCVNVISQQSSKPTWLLGLDYQPTSDILVYGKYSRGYRAGTVAPNVTAPLNIVKPESVDTYEVGFKSSFKAPVPGTFNVSAFYNDFSNQQIQVGFNAKQGSGLASTAAPVNVGTSEIYGLEFSGSLNPFEGLVIEAGYTYLKTKIKTVTDISAFNDPNFVLSAPFTVGDEIPLSPKNKAVVDVTYTLPLAASIGKVSVGGTYSHSDKALANYSNRTVPAFAAYGELPATDLLDLNASWNDIAGSKVDLSFFATNVTGQKYYVYAPGLASAGLGFETIALGQPRMYGMRLKYRFGG